MSCIICYDDDENGYSFSKLKCTHEFHSKCLNEWIDKFPLSFATCPLCRTYIPVPIATLIYYTLLDRYNLLRKYITLRRTNLACIWFCVLILIIATLVTSSMFMHLILAHINPTRAVIFFTDNEFDCPSGIVLDRYNGYECVVRK